MNSVGSFGDDNRVLTKHDRALVLYEISYRRVHTHAFWVSTVSVLLARPCLPSFFYNIKLIVHVFPDHAT